MAVLLDVGNGKTIYENLRNGFVMADGAVYGLVSATVEGFSVEFLAEQRSRSASAG